MSGASALIARVARSRLATFVLALALMLVYASPASALVSASPAHHYDGPTVSGAATTGPVTPHVAWITPPRAASAGFNYDLSPNPVATNGLEADLALAREHLTGLGPEVIGDPANQAMLGSIEDAIAAGRPLTSTELNFLQHELTEAELMAEGVPYTYGEMFNPFAERPPVNAHDMAWIVDGMKPGSNYYGSLFDESYYQWLMGQQ